MKIKNEAITILTGGGIILTYIFYKHNTNKPLSEYRHRLRIKEVIYGRQFAYYNKDMDFSNSIAKGSKILVDNRNDF